MYNRKSPFVKFAESYCNKMGLFTVDATGHKVYDEGNIWEGILMMHEHVNKNRQGKK
jgi:hypothetical protein